MTKFTRRRFIGTSLTAAAAASSAPWIARAKSVNGKMGIAVVGVNSRGGSHLGGFIADQRTDVVAVVDIDTVVGEKRTQQVEEQQGFRPKFYRDVREAIADASVDAISTATPNHWHALIGVWAMQSGKDAYIEKPICHEVWEGSALVAAARKYGRICQVGTQRRSSSAVRECVAFIASGGIGEVKFARGLCYKRRQSIGPLGDYKIPESCDFSLWSGPAQFTNPKLTRERFHYDWHWQRLYGNGDLGNQGPHQTDVARWGLGLMRHPNTILSYGGRLGYQAERNDDNYVDAGNTANTEVTLYDYGDKFITFETRGLSVDNSADEELNKLFQSREGNKIGVVWYGSEGYAVEGARGGCVAYDKNFNVIKQFRGGDDGDHFQNFADACISRNRADLNAEAIEGHLSASLSHLGNISYYLGEQNKVSIDEAKKILAEVPSLDDNLATLERTQKHLEDNGVDLKKYPISMGPLLKFDPDKEVFPGNTEATAMLTREYREGFVCPTADKV